MTPLIEKNFKTTEIEAIAKKRSFNKETYDEFLFYIDENLREEEAGNGWQEENFRELILQQAEKYITIFSEMRKNEFSIAWSRHWADRMSFNDSNQLLAECYDISKETSIEQAKNDLLLYCKMKGADELFIKYFMKSVEYGELYAEPNAEKKAKVYSDTYKELIKKGKSEIYAEKFAVLTSFLSYDERYIEDFAYAYDMSITEGKDKYYAEEYAEKYASELIDVKARAGISDDKEMLEHAKLKAKAYIIAWDYARMNIQKEKSKFIEIFEWKFMNMFYSDDEKDWVGIEKIEEISIASALEEYNRYMDRKEN